jgi:hypothetical protein
LSPSSSRPTDSSSQTCSGTDLIALPTSNISSRPRGDRDRWNRFEIRCHLLILFDCYFRIRSVGGTEGVPIRGGLL